MGSITVDLKKRSILAEMPHTLRPALMNDDEDRSKSECRRKRKTPFFRFVYTHKGRKSREITIHEKATI